MPKTLEHEIYKNRELTCRCGKHIASIRLHGQVLIIGGFAFFNYASWRCLSCNRASSYLAPLLPNEKADLDNRFPDTQMLQSQAAATAKRLGYKLREKQTNHYENC